MTRDFDRQSEHTSRPLSCWRKCSAGDLQVQDAHLVQRALYGIQIIGEPNWKRAVRGEAAAAIGIAIRMALKSSPGDLIVDLVMSPVFVAAVNGDAAARTFLSHMLRKRVAADPIARELAASWIEANRAAPKAQSRPTPESSMRARSRKAVSCAPSQGRR